MMRERECERCRQVHFRNSHLCSTCAEAVLGFDYLPWPTRFRNWLWTFGRDLRYGHNR